MNSRRTGASAGVAQRSESELANDSEEEKLLGSVALQNASSILVDRQRAEQRRELYLAEGQRDCEAGGITLKNCPAYIREWIMSQ
jgi:hypothetical protein